MTNLVKNSDKEKWGYSGYGMKFYNLILVIAKNNFLVLADRPTFAINGSFGSLPKKFSTNFYYNKNKILLEFALKS